LITCSDVSTPAVAVSDPRPNQQRDTVAGLRLDFVVGRQPVALDDSAPGGQRALLVLSRKGDRAHFALELGQHRGRLLCGMKQLALLAGVSTTITKEKGFLSLSNGRQTQHLKTTLLLQVAGQVVLVHSLHEQNDARCCLVVGA
jgi:hypothetical protein